jgi:general secretion pathway protein A
MYKEFYNLARNPFEITPDPTFLFPTQRHNEALASLYYGVRRHKGFVVMTGEVGTGKTLLVRCLLDLLRHSDVSFAYVFNPRLAPIDFLQYISADLGLNPAGKTKGELLFYLSSYLVERHQSKLTTVLIVDEAHHLSEDLLEEIRLLTNLETSQQKLLQILLIGQPELDNKLDSADLRQLKQRIALRCHLEPLSEEETAGYIRRRLQLSGANSHAATIFPDAAIEAIYYHSRGIPRLINTVCEHALLNGFAQRAPMLTRETIEDVACDLRLHTTIDSATDSSEGESNRNDTEVWAAANTLLQLIRKHQPSGVGVAPRMERYEPHI